MTNNFIWICKMLTLLQSPNSKSSKILSFYKNRTVFSISWKECKAISLSTKNCYLTKTWLRKMDLVIKLIKLMMKERKIHRLKMKILNLQKLKESLAYHPNWLILLQISGSMKLTGLIFKLMIRITGSSILNTWKSQQ